MTAFIRHPVDNPVISQAFGAPNTWENPPYHKGIDYAAPEGTPIYAPCDGFIVWASGQPFGYGNTWEMIPGNGNSGNCVILQPPAPHTALQTSFSHMSGITVSAGQWVTAGTLLGYVGNTGFSMGPHLHWEAFIDYAEGAYPAGTFYGRVNPLDYFSTATVVPLGTGGKGAVGPATTPEEGFLMALTEQQQKDIYWILCTDDGRKVLADIVGGGAAAKTLNTPIKRGGVAQGQTSLAGMVAWNDDHVSRTLSAVAAAAASDGATVDEIQAAVKKALSESVVKVDVSVGGAK